MAWGLQACLHNNVAVTPVMEASDLMENGSNAHTHELHLGHNGESSREHDPGPGQHEQRTHRIVYLSFIYLGAVFLFPYNAFITAVDYFSFVFPERNSEALMAALYLSVTLVMVFVSILAAKILDAHLRIRLGLGLFAVSLSGVLVLVAVLSGCGTDAAFAIIMIAVVATSAGAGGKRGIIRVCYSVYFMGLET